MFFSQFIYIFFNTNPCTKEKFSIFNLKNLKFTNQNSCTTYCVSWNMSDFHVYFSLVIDIEEQLRRYILNSFPDV